MRKKRGGGRKKAQHQQIACYILSLKCYSTSQMIKITQTKIVSNKCIGYIYFRFIIYILIGGNLVFSKIDYLIFNQIFF